MARIWVDDLDGKSPAVQTVTFPFEGDWYEIDLSQQNLERFQAALEPFFVNARRVDTVNPPAVPVHTPAATVVTRPAPQSDPAPTAPAAQPQPVAPIAPVAATPDPAPITEPDPEPGPETLTPAPSQPESIADPEPATAPEPETLFAKVRFDPEPGRERELALVGAPTTTTNGSKPIVRFTRSDIPTAAPTKSKRSDDETRALIRDWQAKHPVYKHRARHGRIPHDIRQAFYAEHGGGER